MKSAQIYPLKTAKSRNILAWILASAAMFLGLVAPALWNGFPLIYPDTGGYLDAPISGALVMGRSALYGLFLYAGALFSFWPNVLLQSALIVWLIVLIIRAHGLGGRPWLTLGVVAMLLSVGPRRHSVQAETLGQLQFVGQAPRISGRYTADGQSG